MRESFDLRSVTYGSFTAPGVEEAVASFHGCEPHASAFGGSILLRKRHGSWVVMDYTAALITSACRTYRLRSGRDLLLCGQEDGHADSTSQWVFACDFSWTPQPRSHTVFSVLDTRNACGHSAVWSSINRAALRDLNGDGMPDLTLWVSVGRGTFPQALGACGVDISHVPVQNYKLDFLFRRDANNFVIAPWSKPLAERLAATFAGVP